MPLEKTTAYHRYHKLKLIKLQWENHDVLSKNFKAVFFKLA